MHLNISHDLRTNINGVIHHLTFVVNLVSFRRCLEVFITSVKGIQF